MNENCENYNQVFKNPAFVFHGITSKISLSVDYCQTVSLLLSSVVDSFRLLITLVLLGLHQRQ